MGIINDVKAPAEKVGLHFSVMGILGWVIGAVMLVVVFMLVILPMAVKAKTVVGGGKAATNGNSDVTLVDQGGMGSLGIGWL